MYSFLCRAAARAILTVSSSASIAGKSRAAAHVAVGKDVGASLRASATATRVLPCKAVVFFAAFSFFHRFLDDIFHALASRAARIVAAFFARSRSHAALSSRHSSL